MEQPVAQRYSNLSIDGDEEVDRLVAVLESLQAIYGDSV